MDPRFAHLQSDPRFKKIGKKKKKVKIDNRFKHMFTAEEFNSVDFLDKRGRKEKEVTKEKLEKFYELSSEDDEEEIEEESTLSDLKKGKKSEKPRVEEPASDSDGGDSAEVFDSEQLEEEKESSSEISDSSDGESTDEEDAAEMEQDAWDEVNNCTETTTDSTSRLAICNMNWDRMNATDIFVMLDSVLENKGEISKVEIFPSQYGKERMTKEAEQGPAIAGNKNKGAVDNEYNAEILRRYQIERLRYFYAIVTCDSIITADMVYKSLEGVEYQLSSSILDLRYVPDDMTFEDDPPTSVCTCLPDVSSYKPPSFVTTALQNSSVKLTWDETDQSRLDLTTKKYTAKDLENVDFSAYIASSSSEEESDGEEGKGGPSIEKYKALLAGIEEEEQKDEIDQEMEITWTSGLENNEKVVEEAEKNETRQTSQYKPDENDDFFATDEVIEQTTEPKKRTKKQKGNDANSKEAAELALLMGEDEEERKHFNMKKIVKSKGKKEDNFKIDLQDDRFGALKTSHMYAIDPSAPEYKETPATASLRSVQASALHQKETATHSTKSDISSQSLIQKIKSKSTAYQTKKENSKLFKPKTKLAPSLNQSSKTVSGSKENVNNQSNKPKKLKKKKREPETEEEIFVKPKKLKRKKIDT